MVLSHPTVAIAASTDEGCHPYVDQKPMVLPW
jgi:hypothetical protein